MIILEKFPKNKKFFVTASMSGTSLDGLDMVNVEFVKENDKIKFEILFAETLDYSDAWRNSLANVYSKSARYLAELHVKFGKFLGQAIKSFHERNNIEYVDIIANHGQTIFHQPDKQYTTQIGDGASVAAITRFPVACDFRTTDLAHGGQGAPLVPIGDELLFDDYDYCLNIGGFSNISYKNSGKRFAYDISPANIVLNKLVNKIGLNFDEDGKLSKSGKVCTNLLNELNQIEYYSQKSPKSLGVEWVEKNIYPLIEKYNLSIEDNLATFVEHISVQIADSLNKPNSQSLVTGGGAYNNHLIESIQNKTQTKLVIPDKTIIDYKEALVFALLGLFRLLGINNCLSSVTGAKQDSIGGAIYLY